MSEIRKRVAFAISDPGHAGEGYKGDRSLTEWQTDAVMRVVSELEKANVAYVDANTSLIARIAALEAENERLRKALEPNVPRYTVDNLKAAYLAGYAQGNCLSGTLDGDEEWEEYLSCVVSEASEPDEQDYRRAAEADFQSHVSYLKRAREWE